MTPDLAPLLRELATFRDLLSAEAEALAAADADRLGELTAQREAANGRLLEYWRALAMALGASADGSLAELRARAGADAGDEWDALEHLARETARLNAVNGRLLEEQLRRAQTALQVLRNAASSHGLYDADGRARELFNFNRRIDIA